MQERHFKFRESFAKVVEEMTEKQAGEFIKAVCGYVFNGKPMGSKDAYLKGVFMYIQNALDTDVLNRENGRLGGAIIAERYKRMCAERCAEEQEETAGSVFSSSLIFIAAGAPEQADEAPKSVPDEQPQKAVRNVGRPRKNQAAAHSEKPTQKRKYTKKSETVKQAETERESAATGG